MSLYNVLLYCDIFLATRLLISAVLQTVSRGQDAMDWRPPSCLRQLMRPLATQKIVNGQRTLHFSQSPQLEPQSYSTTRAIFKIREMLCTEMD